MGANSFSVVLVSLITICKTRVLLQCFCGIRKDIIFSLISVVNFYYIIHKLIILVPDSHYFDTDPPFKVPLNRYLTVLNH
jgi:hypothetical protein